MVFFSASISLYAEGRERTWRYEIGAGNEGSGYGKGEACARSTSRRGKAQCELLGESDITFGLLSAEVQELQRSLRQKRVTTSRPGGIVHDEEYWTRFSDRLSLQMLQDAYKPHYQPGFTQLKTVTSIARGDAGMGGSWVEVETDPRHASAIAGHAAVHRDRHFRRLPQMFATPPEQISLSSSSNSSITSELSDESTMRPDCLDDPFGPQPVVQRVEAESKLRESTAEWKKSQVESVHALYEHLRIRDQVRERVAASQSSKCPAEDGNRAVVFDESKEVLHTSEHESALLDGAARSGAEKEELALATSTVSIADVIESSGMIDLLGGTNRGSEDVMDEDDEWLIL
ncbi:hypothetical protein LTR78_007044 [Recurvomyces mirabilis]|uniref:BSD domain-containing protein n=1 Tax=Recurvomyces mirabilis TaxID=574656 RepID=A0AAE1BZ64_9PEZI|nr:hypothetical protein LTR78_007044 [Recurvomyces mirabilis]KAK5153428.1 hypothetical protein LTS14_007597 [Recurvomyces mirabilis]